MADMPLLRRWLRTPEVARWWGDPAKEAAILESDLGDPRMAMQIVELDGQPIAYTQHYEIRHWPQSAFAHMPGETRAIDLFVGEPGLIGAGHGSVLLRVLADRLVDAGAPAVIIDPDPDNARARRAYEKAGFEGDRLVETNDGPAILMIFSRQPGA